MAQTWDATRYDGKHAYVWQQGASLIDLLSPQRGERILDLGCGTGHLTAQLAQTGASVVGMDSSAEMLAQARSAYPQLEFVQADARDFQFDTRFDAVFSNAALHWITPPESVIGRVAAALKPCGRFVAELGGCGNVQVIVAALHAAAERLRLRVTAPRWYFPSVAEYATLLESRGLEVRFATLFDRPTPLEGETGLSDWVVMFARGLLESVPPEQGEEYLRAVEKAARPALYRDGRWSADYRRLRVVAVRQGREP